MLDNGRLKPKKKFSQNFLNYGSVRDKVLSEMKQVSDFYDLPLLEIGPGEGSLTQEFLKWNKPLIAVELDLEAVDYLKTTLPKLKIIYGDAWDFIKNPIEQSEIPNDFVLLSNLPFGIGSRILMDLPIYFSRSPFSVILQKEVVEKINLDKHFTFFGAWLNIFWDLKPKSILPPSVFRPQPKVAAQLLNAYPKTDLPIFLRDPENISQAQLNLKNLFKHPRKSLANNLKNISGLDTQLFLNRYQIDAKTRLSPENYVQILERLLEIHH